MPNGSPGAVTIAGRAFSPGALSVRAGTTVTWTNRDGNEHTVTADGGAFDSGTLADGQSFSFTFAAPGSFAYFCAIHPNMRGTVKVDGAAAAAPPPPTPSAAPASAPAPTVAPRSVAGTVQVRDYEFAPQKLTVGRGTAVTFKNTGKAVHTVTGDGFDSGDLAAGATFVRRFDSPGTFDYVCAIHPRMRGTVEVVADATAKPIAAVEPAAFPTEHVATAAIVAAPVFLLAGLGLMSLRPSRRRPG